MSVVQINKSVKIVDDSFLEITKMFAENNLSKTCLRLCDEVDDKYYVWSIGSTAYMVYFELPTVFNMGIQDILSSLIFYCGDYIKEVGITSDNYMDKYKANKTKKIVFK